MTAVRIQLGDADRKRYDVDGDLVLDLEALKDLTASELEKLDQELKVPVAVFVSAIEDKQFKAAQVARVTVWLALRQAGQALAYADCDPRPGRATFTPEVQARPPADGPSPTSSQDEPPPSS